MFVFGLRQPVRLSSQSAKVRGSILIDPGPRRITANFFTLFAPYAAPPATTRDDKPRRVSRSGRACFECTWPIRMPQTVWTISPNRGGVEPRLSRRAR